MRFFLAFCLTAFLTSCAKQSYWSLDHVHSNSKEFCSTKLCYHSKDPLYGIDLEFFNTSEHLKTYLNVHSLPLRPKKKEEKDINVKVKTEGTSQTYIAQRLAGGQRFLLPKEASEKIIEALKNEKEVTLSLGEYHAVFQPQDFARKFEFFLHPLPIQNPFRLPF